VERRHARRQSNWRHPEVDRIHWKDASARITGGGSTRGSDRSPTQTGLQLLGDFTATPRLVPLALLAIFIGAFAAGTAAVLLLLIQVFTNLFFYQRFDIVARSPADHQLGALVVLMPIVGALIVGLMARYGSDRIRGHGIPEAIEAILLDGSRISPRIALLKPVSAAVSIGSGGPFGAEGPIVMTGGAFGSLIAQCFHLTSAERKTLLVGVGPVFTVPAHPATIGWLALAACLLVGLLAGGLSAILTTAVYAAEDLFERLPLHWMCWPAVGGLAMAPAAGCFPRPSGSATTSSRASCRAASRCA
jgi:H+/Cl- antiporter ClcA